MSNPNTPGESRSEQSHGNDGPWGKEYQESVPPFNPDQKPESPESDDYFMDQGIEQKNLDNIDISTEQGKYEYLDSLIGNAEQWHEENPQEASDDRAVVARQRKILQNLDINSDGQTVEKALEQRIASFAEVMNNPNASDEAQKTAYENWYAAQNLHSILASETKRRSLENSQEAQTENPDDQEAEDDSKKEQESSPENLREKFNKTRDLIDEIKKVDEVLNNSDLDMFYLDFGIDILSKYYGIVAMQDAMLFGCNDIKNKKNPSPSDIEKALGHIFSGAEAVGCGKGSVDLPIPYDLFYEENNLRVAGTIEVERYDDGPLLNNWKVKILQAGNGTKDLNHRVAYDGLRAWYSLFSLEFSSPILSYEGNDEEWQAEMKKMYVSEKKPGERPGLFDYLTAARKQVTKKASEAAQSLIAIQSSIEEKAGSFKEATMNDLQEKINQLEEVKKSVVGGSELDDSEESEIISDVVRKLDALEKARKAASSKAIATERRRLYDELGEGSEEYLSKTIPAMEKRAQG
ncbi:hypothetical protein IKF34_01530 [Candidatus Saccharibacteria bacterium]|nr:hypothetical protein [Candidatus Saccharibacteria bacterium]